MSIRDRQPSELGFAVANVLLAVLTGISVYWGLPFRSFWVDVPAGLVAAVLVASSVALILGVRRSLLIARVAGYALLVWGLLAMAALVLGAAFLRATAGIGGGDVLRVVVLCGAFATGYWIIYPLIFLGWLRARSTGKAVP